MHIKQLIHILELASENAIRPFTVGRNYVLKNISEKIG